ncbi:hypothetical protein HFN72_02825 [Rhizobium laguerreae]|uniref:hypothetical protein n=1 Tax=Rhizobium laguerreae TaxID=1076926 RepID=UPI001C8FE5FC|nr:hypothetical protein [Rhizobium laguerreae]MBY3524918.1 hypothetical protein [Rhizobium laguerreae]
MDVRDLIAHFSVAEIVPIDVQDDVVVLLQQHTNFDVFFWPMPDEVIDVGIYRGMMVQWEDIPFGDEQIRTHISVQYANSLPTSWQRLICCKELIHILDAIEHRVSNELALNRLIEKIVLPPDMVDVADGARVWSDRLAIWKALAILFPWATRELYLAPYQDDKISLAEIADEVDLPIEYVALVMDDSWAEAYHNISKF